MTGHNNPLMRSNPGRRPPGGGASVDDLHNYCTWINSLNWVQASGKFYFVNRQKDGDQLHFIDRQT